MVGEKAQNIRVEFCAQLFSRNRPSKAHAFGKSGQMRRIGEVHVFGAGQNLRLHRHGTVGFKAQSFQFNGSPNSLPR